jgi:hypothetical protein
MTRLPSGCFANLRERPFVPLGTAPERPARPRSSTPGRSQHRTGAALALVQPLRMRLHRSRLSRRVRDLQLERVVVGVARPGVGLARERRELTRDVCEVPGEVYLCPVSGLARTWC